MFLLGYNNTLLIEAQNYLGGRIYSLPFSLLNGTNFHVELGAGVSI